MNDKEQWISPEDGPQPLTVEEFEQLKAAIRKEKAKESQGHDSHALGAILIGCVMLGVLIGWAASVLCIRGLPRR